MTAATTEPVATTATEPTGARFPRTSFIDRQGPSTQLSAVQCCHRLVRVGINRHFDKRETTGLPCIPVFHYLYSVNLAICGKGRIQILLCRLERNVPDINILQGELLH